VLLSDPHPIGRQFDVVLVHDAVVYMLSEQDLAATMATAFAHTRPDPTDNRYTVEYAFLLRDGTHVTTAHDTHVEGLFPRATWVRLLTEAGFSVEMVPRPVDGERATDEVFLARRPPTP
jgi:hypothetical protein